MLDVARETYKENIADIFVLNRDLSRQHELPLTLVYQDTGFVFHLKKTDLEGELPRGFVDVVARRGKWVFSSMELVSISRRSSAAGVHDTILQKKRNARMKDALDETLILSDKLFDLKGGFGRGLTSRLGSYKILLRKL